MHEYKVEACPWILVSLVWSCFISFIQDHSKSKTDVFWEYRFKIQYQKLDWNLSKADDEKMTQFRRLTPIRESWKKNPKVGKWVSVILGKKIQLKFKKSLFGKWVSVISGKKSRLFSWVYGHEFLKKYFSGTE